MQVPYQAQNPIEPNLIHHKNSYRRHDDILMVATVAVIKKVRGSKLAVKNYFLNRNLLIKRLRA